MGDVLKYFWRISLSSNAKFIRLIPLMYFVNPHPLLSWCLIFGFLLAIFLCLGEEFYRANYLVFCLP